MSRDLDGDGELDMLAEILPDRLSGEHERPMALLPSRRLPAGELHLFSEKGWNDRGLRLLPDMDGDGSGDVLTYADDGSTLRILDPNAMEIWSVPWEQDAIQEEAGRQVDLDGDGLVDIAALDENSFGRSIVRLFLSGAGEVRP